MSVGKIERRIERLEATFCNCRRNEATAYHNSPELAAIRSIRCPVHGARDLGVIVRMPSSRPLRPEDRDFCSCLPCAAREWREGKRGPLTAEEWEEEYRSWEEQVTDEAMEPVRQEETRAQSLVRQYEPK